MFSELRRLVIIAGLTVVPFFHSTIYAQNGATLPPAKTYFLDGAGNRLGVKERWAEDGNGEKNGAYIKYDRSSRVIARYTYVHGVKQGGAMYIDEYGSFNWHTPCKFVGNYKAGKKAGVWSLYLSVLGSAFSEQPNVKEEFDVTGTLIRRASFEGGRPTTIYSYNAKEQRTGAARLYAKDGVSYASGNYQEDELVGVWQNATLEDDRYLVYKKGCRVEFEEGQPVTIIDSNGSTRSLKAEARQREMEAANVQAAREAAAAAAPKVYARIAGIKSIRFTPDSYLLTAEGNAAVASIAKQINERASSPQKVNTVYISAHTDGYDYTATDTTKKMMYILTLNRSLAVKLALQEQVEDKSTSFVLYGCAGSLPTQNGDLSGYDGDVRVQMGFDEKLPNAERMYSELKEKFGLGSGNVIVPNTIMRRSILKLVPAYFADELLRQQMVDCAQGKAAKKEYFYKIPQELWIPTVYTEKYGEAATADFRKEIENMFYKLSKKYDLLSLNNGKGLLPSVLFHEELERYTSKPAN